MLRSNLEEPHFLNASYTTSSSTTYPLTFGFALISSEKIEYEQHETTKFCENGCKLYARNGGCPPFAPSFNGVCGKEILVLFARLATSDYPPRVLSGNYYVRWNFVETFLTPLTNKIGKNIASEMNGFFLSSGNCHGCRPKGCVVKKGEKCVSPLARTYSLEATGVFVDRLMKKYFEIDLEWWDSTKPNFIPRYMHKVISVSSKQMQNGTAYVNATYRALKNSGVSILL